MSVKVPQPIAAASPWLPWWLALRLPQVRVQCAVVTGVALALLGALWVRQGAVDVRALRQQLAQAQATSLLAAQQQRVLPEQPAALGNLALFHDTLGDSRHVEQQLRTLFSLAQEAQITLPRGQYRLTCERVATLCVHRVQLPVRGPYPALRLFITQTLTAIPFASVDDLSFKRDSVAEAEPELQIALSLFTQAQPATLKALAGADARTGGTAGEGAP